MNAGPLTPGGSLPDGERIGGGLSILFSRVKSMYSHAACQCHKDVEVLTDLSLPGAFSFNVSLFVTTLRRDCNDDGVVVAVCVESHRQFARL